MPTDKHEIVLIGPLKPVIVKGLDAICTVHRAAEANDQDAFVAAHRDVRAIACSDTACKIPGEVMARFSKLEIVSSFGVGYDHMDVKWAMAHNVVLTNTPDVLTEEVADTALGLLLCTVREFPQAERFLRAGKWLERGYPLTQATLRNRTVGMVGMGAIGQAIAQRLEAFGVPVVYHTRKPRRDVKYLHCPSLVEMARAVDVLMVIVPGGPGTANMINAEVLDALGPEGILINMARGSVVDEPALIKALQDKRIMAAGLDVFAKEPEVPAELIAMDNVVLFPHLGSASVYTRGKMDQLVVDNIAAWAAGKLPLTPVAETPWRSWATLHRSHDRPWNHDKSGMTALLLRASVRVCGGTQSVRHGPSRHHWRCRHCGILCASAWAQDTAPQQAPPPQATEPQSDQPQTQTKDPVADMIGAWELSNADHDKICKLNFRADTVTGGHRLDIDRNCPNVFPSSKDIVAWTIDNYGNLRLLDAGSEAVIELSQVEGGMFDGFKPEEGRYVLQAAAAVQIRSADDLVGDWAIARGAGKPICALTLANTPAATGGDYLALKLKAGCDVLVTRFGPTSWRMDNGELVLSSARGQTWRFEENDLNTWERVPETPDPVLLVRQGG